MIKSRRAIEIANRAILEKKTCECYRIIASEYARISGSGRHIIEAMPLASHLRHLESTTRTTLCSGNI